MSYPIRIFQGYASADESLGDALEKHLAALESTGAIRLWSERKLVPGQDRDAELRARLDEADIILLLISADFLSSPSCTRVAERALERSERNSTIVLPILVRPTDWEITSFALLELLPSNRRPVTSWPNQDDAWLDVVTRMRDLAERRSELSAKELASEDRAFKSVFDEYPEDPSGTPALTYVKESPSQLAPPEARFLVRYLERCWPQALGSPLYVHEGYDFHQTGADSRLVVGRNAIYERMSLHHMYQKGTAPASPRKLRGLYYPSATPSQALLFQAALYFDEIFVVHPGSAILDGERPSRTGKLERRLSQFDQTVLPLKQAGILHCVPPQMQSHPDFIRLITSDLDDPVFLDIVSESDQEPVFVAATKGERLLPLVREFKDVQSVRRDLHERCWRSRGPDKFYRTPKHLFGQGSWDRVIEVAPAVAASILLNHAFLTAEKHGLIPVTDDARMARLLRRKFERAEERQEFIDFRREADIKASALAIRAIEEHLPNFRFGTFEQVLDARQRLAEPLLLFRSAMLSLAAQIEESPYDRSFPGRIESILNISIRPAVDALRKEIDKSKDSFVVKFLRNLQAGVVPIVGLLLAGLPPSAVIALSAGVLTAEAAIETYRDVKAVKRNGFSLLLGDACTSGH